MYSLFTQVASLWKEDKRRWVKESSYAEYVYHLNKHLLPYFEAVPLPLRDDCVQRFVEERLADGLSPSTIRDSLMILRMILRFGAKRGVWPMTEFEVHYPSTAVRKREVPVLSLSNQRRLLHQVQTHFSFRNLGILICLHSGLRIGEVCALQWQDLDTTLGIIHVNKTVQRIYLSDGADKRYELSVHSPKTCTSNRDIPMSKTLLNVIRPLRKVMRAEDYVVSNAERPLEPRYYRDYFNKLLRSLDLPQVRFHALRHSFATRCIESNCDYKTVSVILGHASISTTMDLYVHPAFTEKRKAIERMLKTLQNI